MSTPICNNNSNTLLLFNQGWHFHSLLHFSFFHFTKNILIRAVKKSEQKSDPKTAPEQPESSAAEKLTRTLHISPTLQKLLEE